MSSLTCFYTHCSGEERTWHLYPILARVELDTKERYKFFGCARQRACGVGSGPRRGRSIFRECTPHATRDDLVQKRTLAAGSGTIANDAAKSLSRRGLHPTISCSAVLRDCRDATLSIPGRLFGGLFCYDVMHTVFIGAIGYLLEAIVDLLTPSKKRQLDAIAASLSPIRDPNTGKACRRVCKVTQLSYLTAEQKVVCLFTMAHALGHRATILPEPTRLDALTALSSLQIVCSVTRGKRPFSEAEHNHVFKVIGRKFWDSLARLVHWKETFKARVIMQRNSVRPPSKRKRVKVFTPRPPEADESSDTVDSDSRDTTVPSHFSRSDKIIPHAFVHLPEQVKLGGTYQFHNTSAMESCHKECIQLAGTRVRKYHNPNETEKSMLHYTLDLQLFDEIATIIQQGTNRLEIVS